MEDQPAVTLGNPVSRVHESGNPVLGSEIKKNKHLRMASFHISYNFSFRKKIEGSQTFCKHIQWDAQNLEGLALPVACNSFHSDSICVSPFSAGGESKQVIKLEHTSEWKLLKLQLSGHSTILVNLHSENV